MDVIQCLVDLLWLLPLYRLGWCRNYMLRLFWGRLFLGRCKCKCQVSKVWLDALVHGIAILNMRSIQPLTCWHDC
jgi:hypothetical protein